MTTFSYAALEVIQQPKAAPFYLAWVPAKELLKWADVPRKRSAMMALYQRDLDVDRVTQIQDFLELSPANILPGAAMITLRADTLRVQRLFSDQISNEFKDAENPNTVEALNLLRIDIDAGPSVDAANTSEVRAKILAELQVRLGPKFEPKKLDLDQVEAEVAEAVSEELEADSEALLATSYLEALAVELAQYDVLPAGRQKDLDEYVRSMAKPGLILDGQHRIFGAKQVTKVKSEIRIPVVLLPGMSVQEQVFHFYVLNKKAKPLTVTQLRAIISTSLSNQEISALDERFRQAKVDVQEAQWPWYAHTRPESPFRGLVSYGIKGGERPIPDAVMAQVMKAFMRMPKAYRKLYTQVPQWTDNDSGEEYKLQAFFVIWSAVKEVYPKAWESAVTWKAKEPLSQRQLFYKVGMLVLQEFVLTTLLNDLNINKGTSALADLSTLEEKTSNILAGLSQDFFMREWKKKELDTNKGKALLFEQMQIAFNNEGKNLGNMALFKA